MTTRSFASGPGMPLAAAFGNRVRLALAALIIGGWSAACHDRLAIDPIEIASGGTTTVARDDRFAFSQPAANLGFVGRSHFEAGNHVFRTPRSREKGTGPLLNAASCQGCHVLDGRGSAPAVASDALERSGRSVAMLVRLGVAETPDSRGNAIDASLPDPVYGDQLQEQSLFVDDTHASGYPSVPAEAVATVTWEPLTGYWSDGAAFELLQPVVRLRAAAYGPFAAGLRLSARVAPPVFGAGLLESIAEADIEALIDADDRNGDDISGRPNRVYDPVHDEWRLGRFGFKGGAGSVMHQIAIAFRNDMGLTSRFVPQETCTEAQTACRQAADAMRRLNPGTLRVDLADRDLALVERYVRLLAPPARRGWDAVSRRWLPDVVNGQRLFNRIGCAACHQPGFVTGDAPASVLEGQTGTGSGKLSVDDRTALSGQRIWPYSDLLLHDMGGQCTMTMHTVDGAPACVEGLPCEWVQRCTGLADGYREAQASGREWRTSPLWGLGLTLTVNPSAGFLHDGRARTIEEAVLWHGQGSGSEAMSSYRRFIGLSRDDRQALLKFLTTL